MPGSKSQAWPSQPISEGGLSCVELARPDPGHLVGPQANLGPIKAHLATRPKTSAGGKEFWISDIFRNWLLRGEMGDIQGRKKMSVLWCMGHGATTVSEKKKLAHIFYTKYPINSAKN